MGLPKRVVWQRKVSLILLLLIITLFFPSKSWAWGGDIHGYLCPVQIQGVIGGCTIADDRKIQAVYPFINTMNHLCLDNKPDCPPRVIAKYYVKRYYLEGKKDLNLLAIASHLIQDSYVPDHWYPMRELFGRIFVPFAPSWVATTEEEVSAKIAAKTPNWNIIREHDGKSISVNESYLDNIKAEVVETISQEPTESLPTLETQIKNRSFWQSVRGFKEWAFVLLIIFTPFLFYFLWQFGKKKKLSEDLMIVAVIEALFIILLTAIYIFY